MGLADVRYDLNHGAPRRILNEGTLAAWARSHPPDAEILEVGAGHYDHRPYFAARLTRFDADPAQRPDIVGDAHAMPIEDERFDGALAISVLEHVDDPYQVVREIYRVLKPGARVLAWIPFTFGVHGFPEDVSRFTTFGMRRLFERAGFEVQRIDEAAYAGVFLQATNFVHFLAPRTSPRRWVRALNKVLFLVFRAGYPLDRRYGLRLRTLYTGAEVEARKPAP
ncbi:MAG: class I SAM-dependent methyltransferase [Actinomycetota bacterium]|nr:class I SAM-dependent methyltransferase [Actinomycetota bacterium]